MLPPASALSQRFGPAHSGSGPAHSGPGHARSGSGPTRQWFGLLPPVRPCLRGLGLSRAGLGPSPAVRSCPGGPRARPYRAGPLSLCLAPHRAGDARLSRPGRRTGHLFRDLCPPSLPRPAGPPDPPFHDRRSGCRHVRARSAVWPPRTSRRALFRSRAYALNSAFLGVALLPRDHQ
ncbi:hypothetical protein SMALB_4599 [Streptomyces malaysiensis]|uniref:Uncharacterized protein n=1 Tax=Streptomyces malaysiensis TaxID=92644 RepID=A0A7X5X4P9_STRMQ|nr:hypothetical protein [Streptomyces malaysiensis]